MQDILILEASEVTSLFVPAGAVGEESLVEVVAAGIAISLVDVATAPLSDICCAGLGVAGAVA